MSTFEMTKKAKLYVSNLIHGEVKEKKIEKRKGITRENAKELRKKLKRLKRPKKTKTKKKRKKRRNPWTLMLNVEEHAEYV